MSYSPFVLAEINIAGRRKLARKSGDFSSMFFSIEHFPKINDEIYCLLPFWMAFSMILLLTVYRKIKISLLFSKKLKNVNIY
jgi:hypothetical protein